MRKYIIIFILLLSFQGLSADRYWVSGTGTWDAADGTHWSATSGGGGGASAPGTSDNAIFNSASGLSGATVTTSGDITVYSVTWSATNGTLVIATNLYLSGATGTLWTVTSGMTLTATSSSIVMNVGTITGNVTWDGGGKTYATVTLLTGNGFNTYITGINIFSTLNLNSTAVGQETYLLGANQTIAASGLMVFSGQSNTLRLLVAGGSGATARAYGTTRTITFGALATVGTSQYVDLMDIAISGILWDASAITGNSGDCGGNSGITFTTATTCFWVSDNGSWSTAAMWKTTSGGAVTNRVPLPQDSCVFDANSFSGNTKTVIIDMPRAGKSINLSGVTKTSITLSNILAFEFYGDLKFASGILGYNGYNVSFAGRGRTFYIDTKGLGFGGAIDINAPTGTYELLSAFSTYVSSNYSTFNYGTFDAKTYNVYLTSVKI